MKSFYCMFCLLYFLFGSALAQEAATEKHYLPSERFLNSCSANGGAFFKFSNRPGGGEHFYIVYNPEKRGPASSYRVCNGDVSQVTVYFHDKKDGNHQNYTLTKNTCVDLPFVYHVWLAQNTSNKPAVGYYCKLNTVEGVVTIEK